MKLMPAADIGLPSRVERPFFSTRFWWRRCIYAITYEVDPYNPLPCGAEQGKQQPGVLASGLGTCTFDCGSLTRIHVVMTLSRSLAIGSLDKPLV